MLYLLQTNIYYEKNCNARYTLWILIKQLLSCGKIPSSYEKTREETAMQLLFF